MVNEDTKAKAWLEENHKMHAMANEIIEGLYNMYENGCHDQLRSGLGSYVFRALENYAAQRKVENAALEEWVHA